ncbi:MAG: hypothetical protein MZW92_12955 [Comamonadaceae bacterium]|nr:hypothetical protein [Comamonadaceae bacterium]
MPVAEMRAPGLIGFHIGGDDIQKPFKPSLFKALAKAQINPALRLAAVIRIFISRIGFCSQVWVAAVIPDGIAAESSVLSL